MNSKRSASAPVKEWKRWQLPTSPESVLRALTENTPKSPTEFKMNTDEVLTDVSVKAKKKKENKEKELMPKNASVDYHPLEKKKRKRNGIVVANGPSLNANNETVVDVLAALKNRTLSDSPFNEPVTKKKKRSSDNSNFCNSQAVSEHDSVEVVLEAILPGKKKKNKNKEKQLLSDNSNFCNSHAVSKYDSVEVVSEAILPGKKKKKEKQLLSENSNFCNSQAVSEYDSVEVVSEAIVPGKKKKKKEKQLLSENSIFCNSQAVSEYDSVEVVAEAIVPGKKKKKQSSDYSNISNSQAVSEYDSVEVVSERKEKKDLTEGKDINLKETVVDCIGDAVEESVGEMKDNAVTSCRVKGMKAWRGLDLPESLLRGLAENGFKTPTKTQTLSVRAALRNGRDIVAIEETGSGDTLAFGIPIIDGILQQKSQMAERVDQLDKRKLYAVVLAPTTQSATRLKEQLRDVAKYTGIKVGMVSAEKQKRLVRKSPEIVVATPGCLWKEIQAGNSYLQQVDDISYLVITEAGRTIERGRLSELRALCQFKLKSRRRQYFVFSSTLAMLYDLTQMLRISQQKVVTVNIPAGTSVTLTEELPTSKEGSDTSTRMRAVEQSSEKESECVVNTVKSLALHTTSDSRDRVLTSRSEEMEDSVDVSKTARKQNQTHSGKKPFACTVCEYKSARSDELTRHMRIHTGDKPFACTVCEYKCSDKSNLIRHTYTHTSEKPFACTVCEYKCTRSGDLTRHMCNHTGKKPLSCTECEYKCSRNGELARHMRTHTGEKPFACTECEFKTATSSELTSHMRSHTGEKPYACTVCEYKCRTRCRFTQHMRTHTGEKPFACTECEYKCSKNYNLKTHMYTHTGERPFACTVCESKFTKKDHLNKHMRTHAGDRPSDCVVC